MSDFLQKTTQKARKDYDCDACYWIKDAIDNDGIRHVSFAGKRIIVDLLRRRGGKIRKGEVYDKCDYVEEGMFFSTRQIPEAHRFCMDYDLYPEWD